MSLAPTNIVIADEAELERRARALASGEVERGAAPVGLVSVAFRLGGLHCAVEVGAIERVVLRLGAVFAIPLAAGGARTATFVHEQPLPVVDLVRPARDLESLRDAPALLVGADAETVAVAVEGPLDLSDAPLAAAAESPPLDGDRPRVVGRLADGAALLDPDWIRRFAARALAP